MSFLSFKDFSGKVVDGGQRHSSQFRKTTASVTVAGHWYDLSMAAGNPPANFYASEPLVGAIIPTTSGIYHGNNQSPKSKYLKSITAMCSVAPIVLTMTDLLLYYPFIDGDSTEEQIFNAGIAVGNQVSLPRHTTGRGVKAFLVAQGGYIGGNRFKISYTNSNGVSGKVSDWCTMNTAGVYGTLASCGISAGTYGWSIPLCPGCSGIRSVQSITFESGGGGIFALVLCYDMGGLTIHEANVPSERDFILENGLLMPIIEDGACLNFLALTSASIAAAPFYGTINTVWG